MVKFRNKAKADLAGFERMIDEFNANGKYQLGGDLYKRRFEKDMDDKLAEWYQRKWLDFICYGSYVDTEFYNGDLLCENVCKSFLELYPLYEYFLNI